MKTIVKKREPEHNKNNIITHSPSAVYFISTGCLHENNLGPWLPAKI